VALAQVALVPRSKKKEMIRVAQEILHTLRSRFGWSNGRPGGHIGRRYRRQDKIGTPFCITVDFGTLNDGAATIRNLDSTSQERVPVDALGARLAESLKAAL
jgi:glycyl-tRNA synthetase